ncbi:MAG TPA: AAA family ATPase, partial [Polyangiaceae bacterium]
MTLAFGAFVVQLDGYRLLRDGKDIALEPKAFDLLRYLLLHRGRVVSKQELLEAVWGAKVLSEGVLSNAVAKLRRALGQAPDAKEPIETAHGRGYCFRAEVRELDSRDVRVPHAPLLPRSTDPFVGRDAILDLLMARLGRAHGGSENLVVLLGEAGAGKTRLARELSGVARSHGVKAWLGSAYEHGGAPAYWPWIQLLRACHEELSDPVWRRHLGPGAWAIAQLMPELELTLPAVDLDTQLARFQLFQEVTRFFKSAALDHSVLLILDDLQWADPGTIELCGFVARALQEAPILLLATQRTGELPADVDTPGPLDQLGRLITPIGLPGLTEGEVSELARLVTGQDAIESKLVRALH